MQEYPDDKGKVAAAGDSSMSLFFLIFFLVYGSVHGYFLLRARQGLALGNTGMLIFAVWLLVMMVAPLAVRLLERGGHEQLARACAFIGYCWMGFLFLFLALMLVLDLWRFIHYLAGFFVRVPTIALFAPRPLFLFCCLVAALAATYGWFEAQVVRTEQVVLPTAKLPPGVDRVRIALISDLHVGLIVRDERVSRVVEAIRRAAPDMVVATGDIVDGHVSHVDGVSEMFRGLTPPLGMFAVYGNHEYYAGFGQATNFLQRSGFRLLRGEQSEVDQFLTVVGVDDPVASQRGEFRPEDESRLLQAVPSNRFVLLLKHRPVVAAASQGRFDLQLSGHVHKGQVFPFNLLTWLHFPVRAGLTRLAEGGWLYISRGSGTWGPPIRVLAPPEVTIIDLVPTSISSAAQYGRSS